VTQVPAEIGTSKLGSPGLDTQRGPEGVGPVMTEKNQNVARDEIKELPFL
jgi:hypothetical protein